MRTQYKEQAKELFWNIMKPTSGTIINARKQLRNQTMQCLAEMLQLSLCKEM